MADVDGDGGLDEVYLYRLDDGSHQLAICGPGLATTLDIGGQNKPPDYRGVVDIDQDGSLEVFYSGATGRGVIYFAATLIDGRLTPVEYSWPLMIENDDGGTPFTGSSFTCDKGRIETLHFEPDGSLVQIQPISVELDGTSVVEIPGDPYSLDTTAASQLWRSANACFDPLPTIISEPEAVPLLWGVLDPSGFGVAAGLAEIPRTDVSVEFVPGLFVTDDAGRSWVEVTPPPEPPWQLVASIDFLDRNNGHVILNDSAMGSQLAVTSDGGASWTTVAEFAPLFHAGDTRHAQFLDVDAGWMYSFVPPATGCAVLQRTNDGGRAWETINQCLPDNGDISFEDDGTGWIGGTPFFASVSDDGDSLHRTIDDGQTWTEIRVELPAGYDPMAAIYGVPELFNTRGLLAVNMYDEPTQSIGVYTTDDVGIMWELLTVVETAASVSQRRRLAPGVAFPSENTWWIAASGDTGADIMVTTDAGATWQTHLNGPPGTILEVQALDDRTAWLTTSEGLFTSYDGGKTWNRPQFEA